MEINNLLETKTFNGKMACLFLHKETFKLITPTEDDWMSEVIPLTLFNELHRMPVNESVLKVKELIFNWLSQNDYLDKFEIVDITHSIFKSGLNKETIALVREFKINQILND